MKTVSSVTPGKITAIWRILNVLVNYSNISESDLLCVASNTSLRGGGLPVDSSIELALVGGFISIKEERVRITSVGKEIVQLCDKEEPTPLVIRLLLLPLVLKLMPSWITFSIKPFEERIIAIPDRWKEVLQDAELLDDPLSESANSWWESLQREVYSIDCKLRKEIGNAGESLTMEFEKKRLINEGYTNLADNVYWVSKESDIYGYDISSFFGRIQTKKKKSEEIMFIEVKSTKSHSNQNFRFFLTRNEWDTAEKYKENYYFYFWTNVKIDNGLFSGIGPFVLPAPAISSLIPQDVASNSKWTECSIILDFNRYRLNAEENLF